MTPQKREKVIYSLNCRKLSGFCLQFMSIGLFQGNIFLPKLDYKNKKTEYFSTRFVVVNYLLLLMNSIKASLGWNPTVFATCCPSLNNSKVGIDIT